MHAIVMYAYTFLKCVGIITLAYRNRWGHRGQGSPKFWPHAGVRPPPKFWGYSVEGCVRLQHAICMCQFQKEKLL